MPFKNWLPNFLRRSGPMNLIAPFENESGSELVVKIADSVPEFIEASRLVHDSYVKRGIMEMHPAGLRATPHGILPTTLVLVAKLDNEVVGTISIFCDSPLGLPLESIYRAEVAQQRTVGGRLIEFGALAVRSGYRGAGVMPLVVKLAITIAREVIGADVMVCAMHPAAAPHYQSALLMEQFGAERSYPGLNPSATAVGLVMHLKTLGERLMTRFGDKTNQKNPYSYYFLESHPHIEVPRSESLERARFGRAQASSFLVSECPELVTDLSLRDLSIVQQLLPKTLRGLVQRRFTTATEELSLRTIHHA